MELYADIGGPLVDSAARLRKDDDALYNIGDEDYSLGSSKGGSRSKAGSGKAQDMWDGLDDDIKNVLGDQLQVNIPMYDKYFKNIQKLKELQLLGINKGLNVKRPPAGDMNAMRISMGYNQLLNETKQMALELKAGKESQDLLSKEIYTRQLQLYMDPGDVNKENGVAVPFDYIKDREQFHSPETMAAMAGQTNKLTDTPFSSEAGAENADDEAKNVRRKLALYSQELKAQHPDWDAAKIDAAVNEYSIRIGNAVYDATKDNAIAAKELLQEREAAEDAKYREWQEAMAKSKIGDQKDLIRLKEESAKRIANHRANMKVAEKKKADGDELGYYETMISELNSLEAEMWYPDDTMMDTTGAIAGNPAPTQYPVLTYMKGKKYGNEVIQGVTKVDGEIALVLGNNKRVKIGMEGLIGLLPEGVKNKVWKKNGSGMNVGGSGSKNGSSSGDKFDDLF